MDVVEIIRSAVDRLPDGPHSFGLKSVIRHIDAAVGHLVRGQSTLDEGAFTDAIYRTNQAFEGSVKEAYRVLAGKEPAKLSPATIESYLERQKVLRDRVLIQLKRYRQEWRNPSTHDYNLDFDEDEAFLAIVSVSAFAKVLIDQIAQKLAYEEAAAAASDAPTAVQRRLNVPELLLDAVQRVSSRQNPASSSGPQTEAQILGAIAGYLSKVKNLQVSLEPALSQEDKILRPDMLISHGDEQWVVELKRYRRKLSARSYAVNQLFAYMGAARAAKGILVSYKPDQVHYHIEQSIAGAESAVVLISPVHEDNNREW